MSNTALSQIIAKDSHYDRRIPIEGYYDVLVRIQKGNVTQVKITEIVHENDRKPKGGGMCHQQHSGTM